MAPRPTLNDVRGGGISDYDYPRVKLTNRASIKRQLLVGKGRKKTLQPFFSSLCSSPSSSAVAKETGAGLDEDTPLNVIGWRGGPLISSPGQLVEKNLFKKLMTRDQSGSSRVKRLS